MSSSSGIYRSTNGGSSWSGILPGSNGPHEDLAFKPGSSSIIYGSGRNRFIRSTNGGNSWSSISLPVSSPGRLRMAVSAANSNYVYLLSGNAHVLRSTNSGASFSLRTQDFNLVKGQSNHNLGIAANPNNANDIYVAGLQPVFQSTNGGTSFSAISTVTTTASNYIHFDVMEMEFVNATLYVGSDGGLNRRNANNGFDDLSTGLGAHLIYFINSSATDREVVTLGSQDNGTSVSHGPASDWTFWNAGDGGDGAVHPLEPDILYGTYQLGRFIRSLNGGESRTSAAITPENGQGSFISTPVEVDLNAPNRVYIGYRNLYRHENAADPGSNWINTSASFSFGAGSSLEQIMPCPSNSNKVYVSTNQGRIFRTSNILANTPSWQQLSAFSVQTFGGANQIAVNPYDENRLVAVTTTGAVVLTTNGGNSFTDISANLPALPISAVVMDRSPNQGIYVAFDRGGAVYYKNNTMTNWTLFSNGLPNVRIDDINLFYGASNDNGVRVGTHGRGMWESPLFDNSESGPVGVGLCDNNSASLPHAESFESGFGVWQQAITDDQDWIRRSGSTPTSGTGPSGAIDGNYYIHTESSFFASSQSQILTSPCFDLTSLSNPEISFYYHLYGVNIGSMDLEISIDGGGWTSIWNRSGNQGNQWFNETISLASYATSSSLRMRFNAVNGFSTRSDMALDGFALQNGSGPSLSCNTTVSLPYAESFESWFGRLGRRYRRRF